MYIFQIAPHIQSYKTKLLDPTCSRQNESVIAPVMYLTGDNATMLQGIPPRQKPQVTPGFVQFRSLNPNGEPNALCPGIK